MGSRLLNPMIALVRCAVAAWLFVPAACSPGDGGSTPAAQDQPPGPGTPIDAYEALRREIYAGKLIALYDSCSERYRAEKFPADRYRREAASNPGLARLGLTSEKVARQTGREAVETWFNLLPADVARRLIIALSETKVVAQSKLPDGRMAVDIDSGGEPSRLIWVLENGAWKMDGEEKIGGGAGR